MPITPEESRIIEHIRNCVEDENPVNAYIVDYLVARATDDLVDEHNRGLCSDPHPDTKRLDWLQNHRADLTESSDKWHVEVVGGYEFHCDDPRDAIDAAMKEVED